MQKDQAYHKAAILYNEGLAEFAENLAKTLGHPEVQKWCVAVGKQHRFHAKRHRSALNKLLLKQTAAPVEALADGLDVPEPSIEGTLSATATVTTPSESEVEEILEPTETKTLPDGCSPFHNPTRPECEFYPKSEV